MKNTIALAAVVLLAGTAPTAQNSGEAGRNWVTHQGDQGGTRFSTLTQIDVANVSRLRRAWTFHTGSGRFIKDPIRSHC